MRSNLIRLILLLAAGGVAGTAYYLVKRLPERRQEVATFQVKRGDLTQRSYVRGELRPVRSITVTAPNLGSSVQVTRLATAGAMAQAKDLIVEFDDSDLKASLEEAELEVAEVDENIKKAEADLAIRRNQDQVELLRAQYAVRRGELEVRRAELLSKIDARKNELTLEEARRASAKLQEDVKSRVQQAEAELAVLRERRRRVMQDVRRARQRVDQTRILTPMTGLVALKENRGREGFMFGQQVPEVREGDQVSPGSPLAEVLDLSEMEISARVNEIERASIREGQEVLVRLDALPGKVVHGRIKNLSGTASSNIFSGDPTKRFDCTISVDMPELLTHVGAGKETIERIMATAAENAKRFASQIGGGASPVVAAADTVIRESRGGPGGRGAQRGERGADGGGSEGRGGAGAAVSDADRQKMREAFQQAAGGRDPRQMSAEERQKFFEEMRQKMGGQFQTRGSGEGGAGRSGGGRRGGREGGGPEAGRERGEGPRMMVFGPGQGQEGSRRGSGGPRGQGSEDDEGPALSLRQGAGDQQFTAEEREKAELPAPTDENSVMNVLLRPGLLAEIEIIVEKIPNTLYVLQRGVFEKGEKTVVYVRAGDRVEQRPVKLGKRTESRVAVLEGLREGEVILLADPEAGAAQPARKKTEAPRTEPVVPRIGSPGGSR